MSNLTTLGSYTDRDYQLEEYYSYLRDIHRTAVVLRHMDIANGADIIEYTNQIYSYIKALAPDQQQSLIDYCNENSVTSPGAFLTAFESWRGNFNQQ